MNVKKILFFFTNILISILILEIILQLYYKLSVGDYLINRANLPLYESDKTCCWKLKKNLDISHKTSEFSYNIYTNNLSQRIKNKSVNQFEMKNGKTVLFMGPSFGFGWGVDYEKSYAKLIGDYYIKNNFKNIINASVPGHLPSQQLCWYLQEGFKLNPDVIIHTLTSKLQLYIPDDINFENPQFCKEICGKTKVNNKGFLTTIDSNLINNPKFYLKNSAVIFYSWYFFTKIQSYFISNDKIIKSATGLEFQDLKNYSDKNYEKKYDNYIKLIKSKNSKTKVIFLFVPDSYNVHLSDRARWSHQNIDFESSLKGYKKNIDKLKENYNFVDSYPYLAKVSRSKRLYYYVDTHFNELGNQITFDIFNEYCMKNDCY